MDHVEGSVDLLTGEEVPLRDQRPGQRRHPGVLPVAPGHILADVLIGRHVKAEVSVRQDQVIRAQIGRRAVAHAGGNVHAPIALVVLERRIQFRPEGPRIGLPEGPQAPGARRTAQVAEAGRANVLHRALAPVVDDRAPHQRRAVRLDDDGNRHVVTAAEAALHAVPDQLRPPPVLRDGERGQGLFPAVDGVVPSALQRDEQLPVPAQMRPVQHHPVADQRPGAHDGAVLVFDGQGQGVRPDFKASHTRSVPPISF